MYRFTALIALSFMAACTPSTAEVEPDFDACLISNMAAVQMLETDIEKTEEFLTRARMTKDAYEATQAELAKKRMWIDDLLNLRADLLRDDTLDADEQAARTSVLMRSYASGADAEIANARANDISAAKLAAQATSCAEILTN